MDRTPGFENFYDSSENEEQKNKSEQEKDQEKDKRLSLFERLSSKEGEEKVLKQLLEDKPEKESKEEKAEKKPDDDSHEETDGEFKHTEPTEQEPVLNEQQIETAVSEIMQEHIEERLTTLTETVENTNDATVEHAQAEASKELLEAVDERLKSGQEAFNPVVEAEYQRIKDEALTKLSEQEGNEELAPENSPNKEASPIVPLESSADDSESQATTDTTKHSAASSTSSSASPAASAATARGSSGSAGSSSGGAGPSASSSSSSTGGGAGFGGVGSYSSPPPVSPEAGRRIRHESTEEQQRRSRRGQDLLAGGVVGYMIGRRGGRKRTEAKLNPKIKELEAEVETAKKNLSEKEQKLQRIVAASFQRPENAPRVQKPVAERAEQQLVDLKPEADPKQEHAQPKPVREVLRRAVEVPTYLQASEIDPKTEVQAVPHATKQEVINAKVKRLDTLSTPEILAEAEHFYAGGTNVRRLYETNQIDRKGLIHLVKEGYRGKDLRKAFEKVELGRERQRERAREFRHDDPTFSTPPPSQQASSPLPPLATPTSLPNQPDQNSVEPIAPILPPLNMPSNMNSSKTTSNELPAGNPPSIKRLAAPAAAIIATAIALIILFLVF